MKSDVKKQKKSTHLPVYLRPFFWDYQFNTLSWPADQDLITRKILADGSWEAVKWLRTKQSDANLKQWIIDRSGQGLDPKQLRFWELALGIKHSLVNQWLQSKKTDPWYQRTRK